MLSKTVDLIMEQVQQTFPKFAKNDDILEIIVNLDIYDATRNAIILTEIRREVITNEYIHSI